jgi:PmbA protein
MERDVDTDLAVDLARTAVKRGASVSEVIIRRRTEFSVGVRHGEVETLKQSSDQGLGLRVLLDGKQASVAGSDLSREALDTLVSEAVELARATSPDDNAGLPHPDEFTSHVPDLALYDPAIQALTPEEGIELALRAERAAAEASPLVTNFEAGGFESVTGSMTLANSLGFSGWYRASSCSLSTVPIAADAGRMQRDYWYDTRRKYADLDSPEQIGVKAAERTIRKLGARPVPTQSVPVIFEPNVARELLGDIFQAVSGESILRKASFMVGRLGEQIATRNLTVIDDGTIPGALGSRPFDAEGLPTRRTVIIRSGVLESFLLNTYTARKLGLKSTGNCARGLVGSPGVEAGNLYIEPGTHSAEEIIGSVSKGLLVTELIGFGVNIVTGDYSRSASGMWIEGGEIAFPVQGVTIAGSLKEMLRSIEMIGSDLDFRGSVVSPTLMIGRMTIGA